MTTTKGLRRRRQRRKYGGVNDRERREATAMTKDTKLFGGRDGEKRKGKNPKNARRRRQRRRTGSVGSVLSRTLLIEWFGAVPVRWEQTRARLT